MEPVLDAPVAANELQEPLGGDLGLAQIGDEVCDLGRPLFGRDARAGNASDLLQVRPVGVAFEASCKDEFPNVDASVPFIDSLCCAIRMFPV